MSSTSQPNNLAPTPGPERTRSAKSSSRKRVERRQADDLAWDVLSGEQEPVSDAVTPAGAEVTGSAAVVGEPGVPQPTASDDGPGISRAAQRRDASDDDRRLEMRLSTHLASRGIPSFQRIRVSVAGGVATLRGAVDTKYEKQLLVHTVRKIADIDEVIDDVGIGAAEEVRVERPRPATRTREQRLARKQGFSFGVQHGGVVAVLLVGAWFLPSCGKRETRLPTHATTARVVFNGKPVEGAFVVLHPKGGGILKDIRPSGTSKTDGSLSLTTYTAGDGAPEGEYGVTVVWYQISTADGEGPKPGPNVLPQKYATPETTPLLATVKAGTNDLGTLEIKK